MDEDHILTEQLLCRAWFHKQREGLRHFCDCELRSAVYCPYYPVSLQFAKDEAREA
jgi:hypothetical protein